MSTAKTDRTLDGLELHSAHGYLLDSFLRAGRVDYVCDLVREICLQLGPGYPIAFVSPSGRYVIWRPDSFRRRRNWNRP